MHLLHVWVYVVDVIDDLIVALETIQLEEFDELEGKVLERNTMVMVQVFKTVCNFSVHLRP